MNAKEYQVIHLTAIADGMSVDDAVSVTALHMTQEVYEAAKTGRIGNVKKQIIDAHTKWNALARLEPIYAINGLANAIDVLVPSIEPITSQLRREGKLPKRPAAC